MRADVVTMRGRFGRIGKELALGTEATFRRGVHLSISTSIGTCTGTCACSGTGRVQVFPCRDVRGEGEVRKVRGEARTAAFRVGGRLGGKLCA